MATRTEPIPMCSLSFFSSGAAAASAGRRRSAVLCVAPRLAVGLGIRWPAGPRVRRPPRLVVSLPLGRDQFVQPADLALDRLQAVPLQLEGVAVDPLPGPGQAGPERLDPLFKPAAPALQNPEPDLSRGQAEEREPHAEPVVLPGRRASLGEQVVQALLSVGRQPVDDLGAAPCEGLRWLGDVLFGDEAAYGQVLQARVQRPVAESAECAEHRVEPLAQFVAVHRRLVQQPEDGKFEHAGPLAAHLCSRLLPCPGPPGMRYYQPTAGGRTID